MSGRSLVAASLTKRMDSAEIKRLAENWFRPRLHERIDAFRRAGQMKLGGFAARGVIMSGAAYSAIEVLAVEEIEWRGNVILEGYAAALGVAAESIPRALQHQVAHEIEAVIAAESEQVRQSIQYVVDAIKPPRVRDAAALRAQTLAKVSADFDLLCAKWNNSFATGESRDKRKSKGTSTRARLPSLTQKQLFQEAASRCVFCRERDVSALQIHHIDSNRANDAFENLIVVCATCHAKITAGGIPESEVRQRKRQLKFEPQTADAPISNGGGIAVDRTINTGTIAHTINKFEKGRTPRMHHPQGSIGADAIRRNYIDYLMKRYAEWRKADASYGSRRPFSYAVIHKNIQKEFGAQTFFVLVERFDELSEYLHRKIDNTILGRNKRSRGERCYKSFTEYQAEQLGDVAG